MVRQYKNSEATESDSDEQLKFDFAPYKKSIETKYGLKQLIQ